MSLLTLKDPFASDFPSFLEESLRAPAAFGPPAAPPPPPQQKQQQLPAPSSSRETAQREADEDHEGPGRKRARKEGGLYEVALCGTFSGAGSYVATGMARTGFVAIRDLVTRHIVVSHRCHEDSVTAVSYLPHKRSRILLTASASGELAVFNLEDFACILRWRQGLSIASAAVVLGEPPDIYYCLVCRALPSGPQAQIARKEAKAADPAKAAPEETAAVPWPLLLRLDLASGAAEVHAELKWDLAPGEKPPRSLAAAFSTDGDYIYVGGAGGTVHVFDTAAGQCVTSARPLNSAKRMGWIKKIVSSKAKIVLAQANDKVIHMMRADGRTLVHVQDFQDSVENIKWACCDVSPDGEYIIAGCANGHVLHVWNVLGRHMAKLFAPDRGLVRQVLWHPRRPMVLSLGRDGQMLVWATHRSESWTAFAPNFVELEENESYHEREDEFDRNPRQGEPRRGSLSSRAFKNEDNPVDIVTVERDADELEVEEFALPLRLTAP